MKKLFALFLTIVLLLSLSACGKHSVPEPLAYPDYTFTDTPSTEQLRQTAVQAMRDLLSVQWCSPDGLAYYKNGSKKHFQYPKDMTFGGVMYTGASASLFHFLEYYDHETGQLNYPGTADELKMEMGSACADTLLWGWATVTNSTFGGYYPSTMVQKNGYLLVGEYTYNASLNSYYLMSTEDIIKENGQQVMARSYAQALPADALVSSTADHAMMVIEAPYVETKSDGSIDTAASYIMIQDQRGGIGAGFYEVEHENYTVHHSGRISQKFTFDELLEKNYIPVTAPEFTGKKAYDAPEVSVNGEFKSLAELLELSIESNYPLALINIRATDAKGKETLIDKVLFNGNAESGVPRSYALNKSYALKNLDTAAYESLTIEVVSSTGKRFTAVDLTLQ